MSFLDRFHLNFADVHHMRRWQFE